MTRSIVDTIENKMKELQKNLIPLKGSFSLKTFFRTFDCPANQVNNISRERLKYSIKSNI